MGIPAYYDEINQYNSAISPNTMHFDSAAYNFYIRYFLKRALAMLEFELPKAWSKRYFMYTLFCKGYIGVFDCDEYGLIAHAVSLTGRDIWHEPTTAMFVDPNFKKTYVRKIDKTCAIICLQPDYDGIGDIVCNFAKKMALMDAGIETNIVNTKLAWVFAANSKSQAETIKKALDDILSGEPAVVVAEETATALLAKGGGGPALLNRDIKQTYIADQMLADSKTIQNDFATFIGIPNTNTTKKERMSVDEVNKSTVESRCLLDIWKDTIQEGLDRANELFGLNLSVRVRYNEEAGNNESNIKPDGPISV